MPSKFIDTIKATLTNSPIWILPDPSDPYIFFTDASRHSWLEVLTQEQITSVKDKDFKSFLPITNISWTFVDSQKNLATLMMKA